ncbi:MAG: hypothetical protein LBJ10_12510 [Clostridiales bacterium]|jgi:hypothetical protein|nr:hypothetical protein [Clostridiales bacterium]
MAHKTGDGGRAAGAMAQGAAACMAGVAASGGETPADSESAADGSGKAAPGGKSAAADSKSAAISSGSAALGGKNTATNSKSVAISSGSAAPGGENVAADRASQVAANCSNSGSQGLASFISGAAGAIAQGAVAVCMTGVVASGGETPADNESAAADSGSTALGGKSAVAYNESAASGSGNAAPGGENAAALALPDGAGAMEAVRMANESFLLAHGRRRHAGVVTFGCQMNETIRSEYPACWPQWATAC